jgi:hypothetical protein
MKRLLTIFLFIVFALVAAACVPTPNPRSFNEDLPPHFYYNGECFSIVDSGMALSELPKDYDIAGKLTLAEGEPYDHLQTGTKNLDNKEVWVNTDSPGWAYVFMDHDNLYHLFTPFILQSRWLYHNGKLYIDCLDRDIFYGTEWNDAANEYLGGGSIPGDELMPNDAVLLGKTVFDGSYEYPDTELGISWSEYSRKEVYADPNNPGVLFLLYPNGVSSDVNNGVRVEIFLLYEFPEGGMPFSRGLPDETQKGSIYDPESWPGFSEDEIASARAVVEEYFRAVAAKDDKAILKTLTPVHDSPNAVLYGEETRTLLAIKYRDNDPMRESYIKYGRGRNNGIKPENCIVFRVSFNIENEEGAGSAWELGDYSGWSMILIRDGKDSPWLIDDQGY